jgi:hypothetical protein
LPTRKPSKTSSWPLAQGSPATAAYAPRELDDHSFGPEDIASISAAFEAALGQLALPRARPERGFFSGAAIDELGANVMKQAAGLKDLELGMLLPGIKINTSETDFYPIKQMQMQRFNGERWQSIGPVMSGDFSGS